jgi:hypothetical protein
MLFELPGISQGLRPYVVHFGQSNKGISATYRDGFSFAHFSGISFGRFLFQVEQKGSKASLPSFKLLPTGEQSLYIDEPISLKTGATLLAVLAEGEVGPLHLKEQKNR